MLLYIVIHIIIHRGIGNRPTFGQLIVLKSSGGSVLRIIDFITSYDQCKCNDFAQILLGDYVRVRKHQNDSKGSKDMFVREVLRDWLSRDDDTVDRTVPRTWNDFAECLEKSGLDGVFVKAIKDIITPCSLGELQPILKLVLEHTYTVHSMDCRCSNTALQLVALFATHAE